MTLVSRPVITLVPDTPLVNSIDPISLMDCPLGSSGSPMEDNVIAIEMGLFFVSRTCSPYF